MRLIAGKFTTRFVRSVVVVLSLAAFVAGSVTAASSARDWDYRIEHLSIGPTRSDLKGYAPGGHPEIDKGLRFTYGAEVVQRADPGLGESTNVKVRYVLPAGLRWGKNPPIARTIYPENFPPNGWSFKPVSESCSIEGQAAICQTVVPDGGTQVFGWLVDVVAERGGRYLVRVEVIDPPPSADQTPRNNSAMLDVVVSQGLGGPVKVSAVKLRRLRPSVVQASVSVATATGVPVRATRETCRATFLGDRTYRDKRQQTLVGLGTVRCFVVFNNSKYKGKTFRATLTFTANGKRITKTFSKTV